jgi:hypothetical protein
MRYLEDIISNLDTVILKDGTVYKFKGIPEDSKLLHIYYDQERDSVMLLIKSEQFRKISEGALIPQASITIYTKTSHLVEFESV